MKPLTRRGSAVTRPHVVVLIGFLIALMWALPAEAGKRGRRSKKARRAQAKAESHKRRPEPSPTPAPSVASNDEADGASPSRAGGAPAGGAPAKQREKVFDFSAIELGGSERMPQLLYFLDRADEELERASLERRSFVPEMMRTLDEENL